VNRRNLSALTLSSFMLLLTCPAFAQSVTVPLSGMAEGRPNRPPALRVQAQVNLFLPGTVLGSIQEQESVSKNARSAIYEIAAQECQVLIKIFKADCKLVSVNTTSNVQVRFQGQGNEGISATGTLSYELADRPN